MQERHEILQIVWIFLLGSIVLYAMLPLFFGGAATPPPTPVVLALGGMIVMIGAIAHAAPQILSRVPVRDEGQAAERRLQVRIVQWSLDESIAVLGLVLYVLGAGTGWLWGACAVAAALMAAHAPRRADTAVDSADLARPDVKIG